MTVRQRLGGLGIVGTLCVLALTACAGSADSGQPVRLPPASGSLDYQLGGAYEPIGPGGVVVRDASAEPHPGSYNVCYVNGFQTQPGESAAWSAEHDELLLHDRAGAPVVDPNWPDEYILDPSTEPARAAIFALIAPVIRDCALKGFDAVDLDNLDIASRFTDAATGRIDPDGTLQLAGMYVRAAHELGLAIGQKNAVELAETGKNEIGFDFAIAESCAEYTECSGYLDSYGEHVLQIEYADTLSAPFSAICDSEVRAPLTILRDRALSAPGAGGHVSQQCP